MELFKGLTQEEFKELRSIIIDIGLIIHYGIEDWRSYLYGMRSYSNKFDKCITDLAFKSNQEIELIIQGVLNE